jgi:hypothetical protein
MSIHWWPREELEENRETVRRINLRLGYRIQISVGQRDGTPRLALPLQEPDGLGRYRLGQITLR